MCLDVKSSVRLGYSRFEDQFEADKPLRCGQRQAAATARRDGMTIIDVVGAIYRRTLDHPVSPYCFRFTSDESS